MTIVLSATLLSARLPEDAQVVALDFEDELSRLFVAAIDFATEDPNVDLAGLLRTTAAVKLEPSDGTPPLIVHGLVDHAVYVSSGRDHHRYRLVLRPELHGLSHRVRSRIFQEEHSVAIIKKIFKDAGISAASVVWDMTDAFIEKTFRKRTYCVQYRESELDFVLRLLEDEGIFFWFEHTEDQHVCHFALQQDKLPVLPGEARLSADERRHEGEEVLSDLVQTLAVTPDAYRTRDWFFMSPQNPTDDGNVVGEDASLELYEYPGALIEPELGKVKAVLRSQELSVPGSTLRARAHCARLAAGRFFMVADAPIETMNGDYLLTRVRQRYRAPSTFASEAHDEDHFFTSELEAIPGNVPFRPARRTPKPRVWGLESAVVTGPPGEEIHVDELGRIKVHFYWDREGKIDDKASCWIRVQQQNTSGSMLLPRVGWEMSIGFLDGDPDRPIALQKMYNRETMPPYAMPDNKSQSALQSATSPGGGATNEIRMQDGSGGMEFFIHASKDLMLEAGNDVKETIAVDTHHEVGLALATNVGVDEEINVGSTQSVNVTGDAAEDTHASKTETIGAMDDWGITNQFAITTGGDRTETIGGLMNVLANQVVETYNADFQKTVGALIAFTTASSLSDAVAGSKTETVGAAKLELIAKGRAEQIGGSKTLTCALMHQKTGKDAQLTASSALTITVGGPIAEKIDGDYTLSAEVVTLTAPGGGELKVGGSSFKGKGAKLTIKGSGFGAAGGPQLKLKGKIDYKA